MKTAQSILTSLELEKDQYTMAHAKKILDGLRFLVKNAATVDTISCKPEKLKFGNSTEERNTAKPKELDGIRIDFTIGKGNYSFVIPYFDDVLERIKQLFPTLTIPEEPKAPNAKKMEASISLPATALEKINKAMTVVSKDDMRPALSSVYMQIQRNKVRFVGTDAHRLFMSEWLPISGKHPNSSFCLNASELKKLGKKASDPIPFREEKEKVFFGSISVSKVDAVYPKFESVIPKYEHHFEVDKKLLRDQVSNILPAANKVTSAVQIIISKNQMLMQCSDVDLSTESKSKIEIRQHNTPEMYMSINGKFLTRDLKLMESDIIRVQTNGKHNQAFLFDDGKDQLLFMPFAVESKPEIEDDIEVITSPIFSNKSKATPTQVKKEKPAKKQAQKSNKRATAPTPLSSRKKQEVKIGQFTPVEEQISLKITPANMKETVNVIKQKIEPLAEQNATVFIHIKQDCISIRWLKGLGMELNRGGLTLTRTKTNDSKLISYLTNLANQHGFGFKDLTENNQSKAAA